MTAIAFRTNCSTAFRYCPEQAQNTVSMGLPRCAAGSSFDSRNSILRPLWVASKNQIAQSIPLREVARDLISRMGRALTEIIEPRTDKLSAIGQNAREIKVIVMTFSRSDHEALDKIAETHNWRVVFAGRWADILHLAKDYETGVVFLDKAVLGSDWKEAIWPLVQAPQRCCLILICSTHSDRFCEQFIEAGGYKVLMTPLQETEVVDAVGRAWAVWKHSGAGAS